MALKSRAADMSLAKIARTTHRHYLRSFAHMPLPKIYREERILPLTQHQVFSVVADIEQYPAFVPWCVATRKIEGFKPTNTEDGLNKEVWEMSVGFKFIRDSYQSRVTLVGSREILAEAVDASMFEKLITRWLFEPLLDDSGNVTTKVIFEVDFEFKSHLYAYFANLFFTEVALRMMAAFVAQCERKFTTS